MTALPLSAQLAQGLITPNRITEGITGRQLSRILKDAAKEADGIIAKELSKGTFSGQVRAAQLQGLQKQIQAMSTELWTQVGKVTQAGMFEAGGLAVDQAIDLDFLQGMPGNAILQYAELLHTEGAQGINDIISRRTEGFTLADRIYANGKLSTKRVGNIVEKGLALQMSAKEIAFRVRGHFSPSVPGGTSYAAMRLARTEINNAHHTTTIRTSKDRPWVLGYKWNLSSSHPRPDPCDTLANEENGMGPGVWAKDDAPDKPHPQCLCYLTHVQEDPDAFMDKLVNGKYDDWLSGKGVHC